MSELKSGIVRKIRLATTEDASELRKIYQYYVERSDVEVSFETETPDLAEFRDRIVRFSTEFPYLVLEEEGKILGYAYAHRCFERAAYRWSAETTVYVSPEARGRGAGAALYRALIRFLTELGYRNLYAVIVTENRQSCLFHERMGFTLFSIFRRTGWKSGRWLDVSWYELQIGSFEGVPEEPTPLSALDGDVIERICAEALNG